MPARLLIGLTLCGYTNLETMMADQLQEVHDKVQALLLAFTNDPNMTNVVNQHGKTIQEAFTAVLNALTDLDERVTELEAKDTE